jgi:hypothetical protein
MLNVYKNQQNRQTGSRNLTDPKTLPTIWSATIDGRNLIFGHKLHIGTPYHGKRFWTHQIPTSCLPILLISIVAEKNATKNGHIQNVCSMCIKINKVGKQEVGI